MARRGPAVALNAMAGGGLRVELGGRLIAIWLVVGIDSRSKCVATGEFFCVECGRTLLYEHTKVRRWFHVFGIGLIPLSLVGDFVECLACHSTYHPDVVSAAPALLATATTAFGQALLHSLSVVLVKDGQVDDEQLKGAAARYSELTDRQLDSEQFLEGMLMVLEDEEADENLANHVQHIAREKREELLGAVYEVAAFEGTLADADALLLQDLGQYLELSQERCADIVSRAIQRRAAAAEPA